MPPAVTESFCIPTYALAETPRGVQTTANPNLDAPIKHTRLRPTVEVPVKRRRSKKWVDGTIRVVSEPTSDDTARVHLIGGPRTWWDHADQISHPRCALADLLSAAKRMHSSASHRTRVAARVPEDDRRRCLQLVSVRHRRRTVIAFSSGYCSRPDVFEWREPQHVLDFDGTLLVDTAALTQALSALTDAVAQAEIVKAPYRL